MNMLPFIEQQPLYNGWNFSNGFDNLYSSTVRSATILSCLLCPADIIPQNPVQNSTSNEWMGSPVMAATPVRSRIRSRR